MTCTKSSCNCTSAQLASYKVQAALYIYDLRRVMDKGVGAKAAAIVLHDRALNGEK